MATGKPYKEVKDRFLADPEFRKEYETLKEVIPYSTDNTYHAAYVRAIGGKLITIDRSDERHFVYIFELTPKQAELAPMYFTGDGTVNPLAYAESHKFLMRLIKN